MESIKCYQLSLNIQFVNLWNSVTSVKEYIECHGMSIEIQLEWMKLLVYLLEKSVFCLINTLTIIVFKLGSIKTNQKKNTF